MTKIGEGKADLEIGGEKADDNQMNVDDEDEIIFPPSEPQLKDSEIVGDDNAVGPVDDSDRGANVHADAVEGGIANPVKPIVNIPVGPPLKQAWNCCACCAVTTAITLIVLTIVGLIVSKYVWDAVSIFSDASDSRNAPFGITVDDDVIIASTPSYQSVSTPYYPTYNTPNYYTPAYPSYPATTPNYYTPTYPTMPTVYYQPASSSGVYYTPQPTFPTLYYTYTPNPTPLDDSGTIVGVTNTAGPSTSTKIQVQDDPQRIVDIVTYINSVTLSGRTIATPPVPVDGQSLDYTLPHEEFVLQYLIYFDPLQLKPDTPSNQFRLRQRYALATLFRNHGWIFPTVDECTSSDALIFDFVCTTLDLGGEIGVQYALTSLDWFSSSGVIPPDVGLLTTLTSLSLSEFAYDATSPSRTLPSSLGQLTNLTNLFLQACNITGTIPETFGQLTRLQSFWVTHNALTGPIPASLGKWTELLKFAVLNNQLTGTIPEAIGSWTKVQEVYFGGNMLTGQLPASLRQWTAVTDFEVGGNRLTGTIPEYIGNWTQLVNANFGVNNFTGAVSNATCDGVRMRGARWQADCVMEISCSCCSTCY